MAHIHRLIAKIIFLLLISSNSFAVEKVSEYYHFLNGTHYFSDKNSACSSYIGN